MSVLSFLPADVAALRQTLRGQILAIGTKAPDQFLFESLALAVFRYQAVHNSLYAAYLRLLNVCPERVTELRRVPFMPISFFKTHSVLTGFDADKLPPEPLTFASSGTTGRSAGSDQTSHHLVPDTDLYDAVSTRIFEQTYGPLRDFHILALLPSYLERKNSSLVYMIRRFMEQTGSAQTDSDSSGFFLHDHDALTERLRHLSTGRAGESPKRILLIGVTFGLLDWAESGRDLSFLGQNSNLIVMETGGMKGRRKELLREEVHELLRARLGVRAVHSEYGMTELLSQAYSLGEGVFRPSSTLRVYLRDINDPFLIYWDAQTGERRTGGMNVVDLANLDSCSFIETGDLGQYVGSAGDFRVIGRFDHSDVRGCNLMVVN